VLPTSPRRWKLREAMSDRLSSKDAEPFPNGALSGSNPIRGCNSDLAQYSHTPIFHHSVSPDSRTSTKRLVVVRTSVEIPDA
jgi:hypothetical protein